MRQAVADAASPGTSRSSSSWRRVVLSVILSVSVVAASTAMWMTRSWPSVRHANLYGEDGIVFLNNLITIGPEATFSRFNGYLVVGIYLLLLLALGIVIVFGLPFAYLAAVVAVLSCVTLGAICSLPYLLLRKRIGTVMSLTIVVALTFVPMYVADADIIGSIGNLKFAIIPLALMLIVYRWGIEGSRVRVVVVDTALLLCVLTNILTIALLPAVVLGAFPEVWAKIRRAPVQPRVFTFARVSGAVLIVVSFVYLVVDVALGIPQYPGYLDGPYQVGATLDLVHHSTTYAFLFPIGGSLLPAAVVATFIVVSVWGVLNPRARWVYIFSTWAALIGTIGFVANRTGLSSLMWLGPVTDQFFYGQLMAWTFGVLFVVALCQPTVGSRKVRWGVASVVLLFVLAAAPLGSTFGARAFALIEARGTFASNVSAACAVDDGRDAVAVRIIPLEQYVWSVPRELACR